MKQYKGSYTGFCIFYIIFAVIVTIFYTHMIGDGAYKFGNTRYIHDRGIREYPQSALVTFPIRGDYKDLVNKEVYYYENKTLKNGILNRISLTDGKFTVNDVEYKTEDFLGAPTGGIAVVGSILDFLTMKTIYICLVFIPGILSIAYVVYNFFTSFKTDKKKSKK